jgi:hypothetical protein
MAGENAKEVEEIEPAPNILSNIVYKVWRRPIDLKNLGLFTQTLAVSDAYTVASCYFVRVVSNSMI